MDINYTEKAKRLMQKAARTTALVIVPLASAISAHAIPFNGPVLPPGNPTCTGSDNGSPFNCSGGSFSRSPISITGIQGVSLFTSGGVFFENGGTATLVLSASGLISGAGIPNGTLIPLGFVFGAGFDDGGVGATVTDWDLEFTLLDGASLIGDSGLLTGGFSDSGGSFVADTSSMTTTGDALPGDTLTEQVTLHVSWDPGEGDSLVLDVPDVATFDYNSTTDISSVPEPGTMGLAGSVFALAGYHLLRRKKGWTLVRSDR